MKLTDDFLTLLKDHWFGGKCSILQICKQILTQYLVPQSLVLPEDPAVHSRNYSLNTTPFSTYLIKKPQ